MSNVCESPAHVGDRVVERRDLLERRIEWRRLTDQGRENVRIVRRECKACVRRELSAEIDGQAALL